MEMIKKICNDNNLDLEDMHDFLISLEEFLKKFDKGLDMDALRIHLEMGKKAVGLFGRSQREYLDSILDFIDCIEDKEITIEDLQEHIKSALDYLSQEQTA